MLAYALLIAGPMPERLRVAALLASVSLVTTSVRPVEAADSDRHPTRGLLIDIDRAQQTVVVSCPEIPGFMDAMAMPYKVRRSRDLDGLSVGDMVDLTVVPAEGSLYAEDIRRRHFVSGDAPPLNAERLKLLEALDDVAPETAALRVGDAVPDFTLVDQNHREVRLSQLSGQVVAISFMYTKCRLANYCFRLSNNLGILKNRFSDRLGRDLVLLTITFDPDHDDPQALARYADTWKAEARGWHFLTGAAQEVQRVCRLFGMSAFPNMGMITHTMRTVVLDREGHLVANLEGNDFSAQQLGDLVAAVIDGPNVTPERTAPVLAAGDAGPTAGKVPAAEKAVRQ